MKNCKTAVGVILATFILISCTACNNNKAVPAMASVSSSSDIGVSALIDTTSSASSTVSSTAPAASSTAPAGTTSKPSTTTGGSTTHTGNTGGGTSYNKPSGGNTGGTTGGNTGGTTGGNTGGTTGGTTTPTPPPAPVGISTQYHGAKYGCTSQSQYDYVMGKANAISGSSKYQNTYNYNASDPAAFKQFYGVDYSDAMNKVVSIGACFGGSGNSSSGSAYSYFTGSNRSCADMANAQEAALHANGINARLAWGTLNGAKHMWVQAYVNGTWYNLDGTLSTGSGGGHSISGSGYNY